MVRKLKYHEQKLLKKVDFISWPADNNIHENKIMAKYHLVYFSMNYVYGSGLAYRTSLVSETSDRYPYSRLDAALIFRFKLIKSRIETGISVLNILNRENIKYSNFYEIPDGQFSSLSIYAEAVPFTPTLYVNLAF